MWDLIVSVPDHCLSFYFIGRDATGNGLLICIKIDKTISKLPLSCFKSI